MDARKDLSRRRASGDVGRPEARVLRTTMFAGNGRALTIGVLAAVGALLALRLATIVWLVDAGWAWSLQQPLPPAVDRWLFPGVRAPVAIDRGRWLSVDDYRERPVDWRSIRPTVVRLTVSRNGGVADCWAERSSGSTGLDDLACARIAARGRFVPASDANGKAVEAEVVQRVDWAPPAIHLPPVDLIRRVDLPADGDEDRCESVADGERRKIGRAECRTLQALVRGERRAGGKSGAVRLTLRRYVAWGIDPPSPLPDLPRGTRVLGDVRSRAVVDANDRAGRCVNQVVVRPPGPEMKESLCDAGRPVLRHEGLAHVLMQMRASIAEKGQP